ncbi:hypothetical protein FACS1894105_11500 [Clostridia bacterium]|nr:hypothetical protein FACS1894105_11500 [Clostridia bacterium]
MVLAMVFSLGIFGSVSVSAAVVKPTAITGVTAPVRGATPVTSGALNVTGGGTATIAWSGTPTTFAGATVYTATITVAPGTGNTFDAILANSITVAGATVTHSAVTTVDTSIVVTAVFPATAAVTSAEFASVYRYTIPSGNPHGIVSTGGNTQIAIDLDNETIYWATAVGTVVTTVPAVTPRFISIDGGAFKAYSFGVGTVVSGSGAKDAAKLLDKGGVIVLTSALGEDKAPASDAITWTFPELKERPKLSKEKVWYTEQDLAAAVNDGKWTFAIDNSAVTDLGVYNIAFAASDKKSPIGTDKKWGKFIDNTGAVVISSPAKPGTKLTFLARIAPTNDTPASKSKKFGVSTLIKAPSLKPDFKKEIIKGKAGVAILSVGGFTGVLFDKDTAKDGIKLGATGAAGIAPYGATLEVRSVANGKKPASEIATLALPSLNNLSAAELIKAISTIKGSSVKVSKGYEIATDDEKWKTSVKDQKSISIRQANTAKWDAKKGSANGNIASNTASFTFTEGEDSKGKPVYSNPKPTHDPYGISYSLPTTAWGNVDLVSTNNTDLSITLPKVTGVADATITAAKAVVTAAGTGTWRVNGTSVLANAAPTSTFVPDTGVITLKKGDFAKPGTYTLSIVPTAGAGATEAQLKALADVVKILYIPTITVIVKDTSATTVGNAAIEAVVGTTDAQSATTPLAANTTTIQLNSSLPIATIDASKFTVKVGPTATAVNNPVISVTVAASTPLGSGSIITITITNSISAVPTTGTVVTVYFEAGAFTTVGGYTAPANTTTGVTFAGAVTTP